MIYKICFYIVKLFTIIFYPYEILGAENLKKVSDGFVLCSNHLSNMDGIFLDIAVNKKINFMAKSELFRNKFFGNFLKKLGVFPVNRGKHDVSALEISENIVKSGEILGMFIEGTRSRTGNFLRPKSGAVIIAMRANCPIIPVCITPSRGKRIKIFTKTKIVFGVPISLKRLNLADDSYGEIRKATNFVMEKIKELRK